VIVHDDPAFWYSVECAVRTDGSSPARQFLDQLKEGMWADDPDSKQIPDDEQIKDYHRRINVIRFVALNGEPERKHDVEYLRDGVWEFKVASKRLAFYDTDGSGEFAPKPKIQDIANSPSPASTAWWFPQLDRVLRLANAWPKVGQKADQLDIDQAIQIRKEDLQRDRTNQGHAAGV
jgi:hypothetical protein